MSDKTPSRDVSPTIEVPDMSSSADGDSVHPSKLSVEITDIKASGLPEKIGLFSGQFYVRIKGDKFTKQSKTTNYAKDGEYVAVWKDSITFDAMESSSIEIEVFARRCFFSYKVIKKTENNQSLGDLLENVNTPVVLELLGNGEPTGKVTFHISKSKAATFKGD
ncbi:uncharacterized protein EDB93DRAFT_159061 [Suillus bovinus]|uniref:uncharacterized protein n=1 Tax=Suillus bovinus TaxID=48563 RepID=UPI001B85D880|nr:uncharacterized protein EDB93DRAFT_159061 [Suillus bovinus]KAG2154410.1 hypothetical protein EDB93DRAFT_159061 [Suillus bovinus]